MEVVQEALLTLHVLGSDIGLAQGHKVVYVIACLKQKAAYSRVRHHIIGYHNGTHVQAHELLYILHFLIHRELHPAKNLRNHLLANEVVVVERPPGTRLPTLGCRLGNVVKQGCPTKP